VCVCYAEKSLEDMAESEEGLQQERLNMQAQFNTQRQGKCLLPGQSGIIITIIVTIIIIMLSSS